MYFRLRRLLVVDRPAVSWCASLKSPRLVARPTDLTFSGHGNVVIDFPGAVARFNSNGSLDDGRATDTTRRDKFAIAGKFIRVIEVHGGSGAIDIAVQTNGKIILGGKP
jgi:hypothetical protein